MIRDFRYIIKRIIIGVGIALVLAYLRGNLFLSAKALTVEPYEIPSSHTLTQGFTNLTSSLVFDIYYYNNNSQQGIWPGVSGYINGQLVVYKVGGDSTSPTSLPRYLMISNDSQNFLCSFNSVSSQNSTFNGYSLSFRCPVNINSTGLTKVILGLNANQQNSSSNYTAVLHNRMTMEFASQTQVLIDISSINNSLDDVQQAIEDSTQQQTEEIIESNQVCKKIDKNSVVISSKYLNTNGQEVGGSESWVSNFGITDYYSTTGSRFKLLVAYNQANYCFYNVNKSVISCPTNSSLSVGQEITIPSNASYVRFTINKTLDQPQIEYCQNGNQAIADSQEQINNTINDDSVDSSTSKATDFFEDFQADSHGLSGIITAPLRLINSLSSSSCSSLTIPLPFVNQNVTLPCMSTIYSRHFSTFLTLYRLITDGVIGYWVLIKIFGHVKGLQNPTDDRIEVFDL